MVFERFTERALQVIMIAQEETRKMGHNYVGTEQMLLGLIGEGEGIAARVLKDVGLNVENVRVAVERIIGRGTGYMAVEVPFTPRAKRILELSYHASNELQHAYIGTEHLMLALLKDDKSVAIHVLKSFELNIQKLKYALMQEIESDCEDAEYVNFILQREIQRDQMVAARRRAIREMEAYLLRQTEIEIAKIEILIENQKKLENTKYAWNEFKTTVKTKLNLPFKKKKKKIEKKNIINKKKI